jgi:hypothetical protein
MRRPDTTAGTGRSEVTAGTGRSEIPAAAGRSRADVLAAAAAAALFALAAVVGAVLGLAGHPVRAPAAPLFGHVLPHVGPGTPLALVLAGLTVLCGPGLADRLRWSRLLPVAYAAAVAWTVSLALVDGWHRGLAGRLATRHEYLSEVHRATVRGFADRILDGQPDAWTTHVAGHPPGALLVFAGLDRVGLGGGGWAATACVLVGASVAVTVPLTVRMLAGDAAARAAVPFVVLFPGAVWVGASADGLFAGVTAAGVALLAAAAVHKGHGLALGAGVVLGAGCFLSYGLVLMAPVAFAVLVVTRRWVLLPAAVLGAVAVTVAFAVAGFWWLDGYHLVVARYHQGIADERPYAYWVWANLACVVAAAGPVAAVFLRRIVSGGPRWVLVPLSAVVALLLADLSGLSKAEVERIWLPFTVWLMAGAAVLPRGDRRGWLAVQAATALAVNHLVLTAW